MATALNKTIRRELEIDNRRYTVTISPDVVRITRKGHRKGHELTWRSLLSGEAELTSALQRSLQTQNRVAGGRQRKRSAGREPLAE